MLLLILGLVEFGRMLSIYNSVSNAAREAARYGSVVGDPGNGATYYFLDCSGMRDAAKRASAFAELTDPDITIVYDHGSGSSFGTCAQGAQPSPSITNADRVVVTVTATYAPILPLLPISSRAFTFTAARSIFPNIATGPQCYDGLDNDGDGSTDWPADSDCPSSAGTSEGVPMVTCYALTTDVSPSGVGTVNRGPSSDPLCVGANDGKYSSGFTVALTASADAGYTFGNWTGNVPNPPNWSNPITIVMDADKTVTANFTHCYGLDITAVDGEVTPELVSGSECSGSHMFNYTDNSVVSLQANGNAGYSFANWTGDDVPAPPNTDNPLSLTFDGDKDVTANFTPVPCNTPVTLELNSGTGGTASANPETNCGGVPYQYDSGTSVTLTAEPALGYSFTEWSGDASGTTNPLIITMDADKTISAAFTANCYSLTTSVSPGGGGSVSANPTNSAGCAAGQYTYNASVSLTANANAGYTFSSWIVGLTGSANPQTLTMPASDASVTARFNANCVLAGPLSITAPGASSQKIQLDYTNYTAATRTLDTLYATWPDAGSNKFNHVYFGPSQELIADPTDSNSPTTIPGPGMNWSLTFNRGIMDTVAKTLVLEFNFNISGSFLVEATFDDGCIATPVPATFP